MTPPQTTKAPEQGQSQVGLQTDLSGAELDVVQAYAVSRGLSLDEAAAELVQIGLAQRHLGRRLAPATVLQFSAMRKRVCAQPAGPAA